MKLRKPGGLSKLLLCRRFDSGVRFMEIYADAALDFNTREDAHFDKSERCFRAHDILGLYKIESVRAVGKICARINVIEQRRGGAALFFL